MKYQCHGTNLKNSMQFCYQVTGKSHYAKKKKQQQTSTCLWDNDLWPKIFIRITFCEYFGKSYLFESESWSFDLIKKDFRSSDLFSRLFPTELTTKSQFFPSQCEMDPLLAIFIKKIFPPKMIINSQYLLIHLFLHLYKDISVLVMNTQN